MRKELSPISAAMLIFISASTCLSMEWHTSPDMWDKPRIFHTPYIDEFQGRVSITKSNDIAEENKVYANNDAYWYTVLSPNTMKNGPWTTEIHVFNERKEKTKISLQDHASYPVHIEWINEKLLYIQVWWGRVLGSYYLYDVEGEEIIKKEMVHSGEIPYQQYRQMKAKQ